MKKWIMVIGMVGALAAAVPAATGDAADGYKTHTSTARADFSGNLPPEFGGVFATSTIELNVVADGAFAWLYDTFTLYDPNTGEPTLSCWAQVNIPPSDFTFDEKLGGANIDTFIPSFEPGRFGTDEFCTSISSELTLTWTPTGDATARGGFVSRYGDCRTRERTHWAYAEAEGQTIMQTGQVVPLSTTSAWIEITDSATRCH